MLPQSLPSFKKIDSALTIISDTEETSPVTSSTITSTMKSPRLCILADKGVFESTRISRSETLQHQVEPNLGNSSLPPPSTSGMRGKRNGYEWMNNHMNGCMVIGMDEWLGKMDK